MTRINSTDYEVKLVDTAGQDEYSIFPAQYSMDFHGYVLVYSITSQKSFEVIQIIYEKLLDVMGKAQYVQTFNSHKMWMESTLWLKMRKYTVFQRTCCFSGQ